MADISNELNAIMAAIYGRDVRQSIHDGINEINEVSEVIFAVGTTNPSHTPRYSNLLYLNSTNYDLYKSTTTKPYTWQKIGNIEGNAITSIDGPVTVGLVDTYTIHFTKASDVSFDVHNGNGISRISGPTTVGLVDIYTINYTDGTSITFDVTNGKDGATWLHGNEVDEMITGSHGYILAHDDCKAGDLYFNIYQGAIYHCDIGAAAGDQSYWTFDIQITGGGGGVSHLNDLLDVNINTPVDGQILTYDAQTGMFINKNPDKSFVRYGGALNFADLATYASTYLTADYEDVFFLLRTSGTIGTGEASQYWSSNFHDGDNIPVDAHIAVININRGTMNPPVYKYDDFGGFVDISGKADKIELDEFTASVTQSNGVVVFDNLNLNYGYEICFDDQGATGNLTIPKWTNVNKTTGTTSGTIKLTYTISGGTNGSSKFALRILK